MKPFEIETRNLFVSGTDTDVGKSVVSFLILSALISAGQRPFYLKPLQTGCATALDPAGDAAAIAGYLGESPAVDPRQSTLYCLPQPKAPWFAARNAGQKIDPEQLLQQITALQQKRYPMVIEGAGGLMVPITENFLMLDLMARLKTPVVLVARDGLGTINHTLLSLAALKDHHIPLLGVVLVASGKEAPPPEMVIENKTAIEHFGKVPVAGRIGWIEDFAKVPEDAQDTIERLLNL